MINHTASLEINVNVHETLSPCCHGNLCFGPVIENMQLNTILALDFHEFLHTMYKYVLNSVVKMSMMFAKYFEYYTIILTGAIFSWTRCTYMQHSVFSKPVNTQKRIGL